MEQSNNCASDKCNSYYNSIIILLANIMCICLNHKHKSYHTRSAVSESAVFDVGSGNEYSVSGCTTTTSFDKPCVEVCRKGTSRFSTSHEV